ncbi:CCHC-type zinc finger transcription factor [Phycomyces blakesleeanus NRRL 1555(-)]|uniref:CCHC-type zinc finger transcription factor n=1 Tax=Phycomyces blakesleeanus (strain ATCC 8743b / DSM 1359 / FGSC 10004 / NBRC 33097 / NRRL 1555) TaxID=763407 RepID=A0A162TWK8_PHYB8|nr:CCHC-type zinc finger transcription factor [Phycomyces blakesleeanus NRRL 1555(-)]OAD70393.1 CCHC-type zinc finger transcription factor [Phycomyces blakesleeanus NRRL 1555(-)]|eukprot:XP_018288433.1 CCHC-type zinc finger transcription factor [Phycomyces blakesleeanus NRRL 1555(-)]
MALPATQQETTPQGSPHYGDNNFPPLSPNIHPSTQPNAPTHALPTTTPITFASLVDPEKQRSLTRIERVLGSDDPYAIPTECRFGTSPHSVFYDLPQSDDSFMAAFWTAIHAAFSEEEAFAEVTSVRNNTHIVELYLESDTLCNRACAEPIVVQDSVILAHRAISSSVMMMKLNITGLPRLSRPCLNELIRSSLYSFGIIKEVVIYLENRFFTGSGYVYLERPPNQDRVYSPLVHKIPCEGYGHVFGTWAKMGPHCRYCKAMGHVLADCPTRPIESRTCHACQAVGHLQATCPRINNPHPNNNTSNKRIRKQPRRESQSTPARTQTLPPVLPALPKRKKKSAPRTPPANQFDILGKSAAEIEAELAQLSTHDPYRRVLRAALKNITDESNRDIPYQEYDPNKDDLAMDTQDSENGAESESSSDSDNADNDQHGSLMTGIVVHQNINPPQ